MRSPGDRTVMLSYSLWQQEFGSAEDVVGKSIQVDGHSFTVAGVMPREFRFPLEGPAPAFWKSLAEDAEGKSPATQQRGFDVLGVIGRLRTGVTVEQAKADLSVIAGNLARQYPDNNKQYTSALVEPELAHLTGDTRPALRVLFGAVYPSCCCSSAPTLRACNWRAARAAAQNLLYVRPSAPAGARSSGSYSSNQFFCRFWVASWASRLPTA